MTALQRGYIVGYADKLSLAAGETIRFMVSCEGAKTFKADLVRTVCGDPNPAAGGIREELIRTPLSGKTFKARKQEVYRGSCVRLHANPATEGLKSFSLQALIWPTTPAKGMQSIISKWSMANRGGYGLLIDAKGAVALGLGDGKGKADMISTGKRLLARHWYFVGASFDAETGEVRVYQEPLIEYGMAGDAGRARKKTTVRKLGDAGVPLLIGAWHERTVQRKEIMGGHFNGKIDSPRMANRALRRADMEALRGDAVPTRLRNALVAAWDFARDISSIRVSDLSVNAVHGEIVNMPARAMTGHNWTGREMCWRSAPEQYGAIHFHDDDLYDAGWEVDCELTLPKNLKSGIYAARLKAGETEDRVTFFVRPERGKATARAAVLMSTACYHAYANINALYWPTAELMSGRLINVHEDNLLLDEHPEWGASLYDSHSDGSGICYSSRLRPVLTMHTHASSAFGAHGSSLREFSADTRVVAWLDAEGIGYDILTDDDLDQEGIELLRPYKAIMTCSHPEYYSTRMWDAMRAYT
ncbi:MAG: LamG domain-containing protein, partial [Alphaproteobacteria bacterium]|nr:LamG domain-containing protein [Alphaproteobacteria bacterium]